MELIVSNTENREVAINLIGANFRTAPISLLENLARIPAELLIQTFRAELGAEEICIIPTCNRFEIIFTGKTDKFSVLQSLKNALGCDFGTDDFYFYQDAKAVSHFYRLAASLDSMFVGETQIVGQIRKFYKQSCNNGNIGKYLHRLFQSALSLSKSVRSNVGLTCGHVSVSSVAVNKAVEILGSLEDKNILLVGAGETARICLEYLYSYGARNITILNRTLANAAELAQKFNCRFGVLSPEMLASAVPQSSLVISAVSSNEVLIDLNKFEAEHQQIFIDLSIPRSIKAGDSFSPQILITIQALQAEAEINRSRRARLAKSAEVLVTREVHVFSNWLRKADALSKILKYRDLLKDICEAEFDYLVSRKIIRDYSALELDEIKRIFFNRLCHKLIYSSEVNGFFDGDPEENLREQFSAAVVNMKLVARC